MNSRPDTRPHWSALLLTLAVTVVVFGPFLFRGGIALRGDMVFTPDQPWKSGWLGLSGAVPRAVPMDAVVSILDEVLPGAVLQRIVLLGAFVLGGLGIARLCARFSVLGQAAAVLFFLWNPWVLERLSIGQWPMVLGYGLLPWLVLSAIAVRDGRRRGWPRLAILLVLCAVCAPSMGLIAIMVAVVVVVFARNWQRISGVLGLGVVANLPWMVPALSGPGVVGDPAQFEAFAARGESSWGPLASLLSMGGIWKSSIVPAERTETIVIAVALLLALACVAAFSFASAPMGQPTMRALGILGGICLLVAFLPTIGPIGRGLGALSAQVGAVGIFRDSHRYLGPWGLVLAVGAAALVDRLCRDHPGRPGRPPLAALAAVVVIAPVVLLPSLAWGLAGGLRPVAFPTDWDAVAALTAEQSDQAGALVVLPWRGNYRGFEWNDYRAVLDPAERYLAVDVLSDDRLFLDDRMLPSEDALLGKVDRALTGPDPATELNRLGVRWVLVEKSNGVEVADVPAGSTAFDGRWLRLVDIGAPVGEIGDHRQEPPGWIVVGADLVVVALLCVSFWQLRPRIVRNQH